MLFEDVVDHHCLRSLAPAFLAEMILISPSRQLKTRTGARPMQTLAEPRPKDGRSTGFISLPLRVLCFTDHITPGAKRNFDPRRLTSPRGRRYIAGMAGEKSHRLKREFHFFNGLVLVLGLMAFSSSAFLKSGLTNEKQEGSEIIVKTKSMMVIVKLPVDYDPAKPYALLVALHGNGGSALGWAPAFNRYANEPFIVAIPQGAYQKPQGGFSWFYETTDRSLWKSYDTVAVTNLLEAVAEVSSLYPVREKFILGFSQGAAMAYMAGILNPAIIRGIIAVGGVMPEIDREGSLIHDSQVIRARELKLLIARGNSDDLVSRRHFTDQRKYFRSKGYDVSAYEYQGGHFLTEDLLGRIRRWLKKNSSSSPAAQGLERNGR